MAKFLPPPGCDVLTEMLSEIKNESDRASGIITAAWVDDALMHWLKTKLLSTSKIDEDLFKGNGPLSTFSSRSKIAYYCQYIGEGIYNDLHFIREVRNKFAHYRESLSYDEAPVCDYIANIKTPEILRSLGVNIFSTPRGDYIITTILIATFLMFQTKDPASTKGDDDWFRQYCEGYTQLLKEKG